MNYRHAYHAGNHCDVLKHMILIALITYLKRKEKPFRVIDTHSGIGLYDLSGDEALKTGEWKEGIGRVINCDAAGLPELISTYRAFVESGLAADAPLYPGSPKITADLLRRDDRLTAIELHPADAETLKQNLGRDRRVKVVELDGWLALKAFLPPKEKRGLVLIDPPYEKRDDFQTMARGLGEAVRRWPTGLYALWYPLKDSKMVADFKREVSNLSLKNALAVELQIAGDKSGTSLFGSGLLIVNPPYTLAAQLQSALPVLTELLAQEKGAAFRLEIIAET